MIRSYCVAVVALALALSSVRADEIKPGEAPPLSVATSSGPTAQIPEIAFDSVPDFLKLPPDIHFGEVAGIALNSKGHIFVLSRGATQGPAYGAAAAQLLEFNPDGTFIREIGHGLYAWSYAHVVRVDREDNIWVMDSP